MRPFYTFKFKIISSFVFVVFICCSFIAIFLSRNLEENSLKNLKDSLINQAVLLESQISPRLSAGPGIAGLESFIQGISERIGARITVIDSQGKVLAESRVPGNGLDNMENHSGRPEMSAALSGRTGESIRYSSTLRMDMFYIALPVKKDGHILGALRLALPLVDIAKILWTIRRTVLLGLIFSIALAFVLGLLISENIVKPINRIISSTRRFSSGDFTHKIVVYSRDEVGELSGALNKMAQDIEEKISEINRQNQHLKAMLNSMIEGVVVLDRATKVISINPTVEKIFNVSKENCEGRLFLEAIRNTDISEIVNEVIKNGEFISKELALVWPVNKVFEVNISPVFEKDSVSGCLIVIHDITEVRKLETMRRDFVANVSHELKTPLTSIKGFVETLLEGALEDKENSRHFLEIIRNHAERLDSLIDDLLDLSKIESRQVKLDFSQVNLQKLCSEVISGFKSQLKKKNIEASSMIADSLVATADKGKLHQVLVNLIGNAVKFNKESGFIKVSVQDNHDSIKVFIEDSGLGIPEKDLKRIFERFYRVDKARSRDLGGTGLGLSIVKHIIELHGGTVGVESVEGLGSKFWFTLPK